ncbi:MAG: TcfC E-set like domain-containing protein [Geminicoccaceae bacterium]
MCILRAAPLVLALAALDGAMVPTAAGIRTEAPAGFEALGEAQTAPVDLYFGARRLGDAVATFAPGWIELHDPAAAVALLIAVRLEAVAAVTAALTGRLATHAGSSCQPERFPGCGTLDLPVAGVIFNPDYFRLDLVAAPGLLTVQEMTGRYLADPVSGPSLLANLSTGASGGTGGDATLVAGVNSRLSLGRNALRLDAIAQTQSDLPVVQALAAEHFGRDHRFSGGLIDDFGTRFSRVPALLGSRIETYLDTRLDLEAAAGTPILVFLPERSQIEILVDGRLVGVRAYEAGNQRIDTSALPRGAYEVTLRIRGGSGAVREERVSFVKELNFPPAGEWQYFAEAGLIADDQEGVLFPAVQSVPLAKAGVSRRLRDDLAGTLTVSATDSEALAEIDLRYVLPRLTGGVQLAGTLGGGVGLGADLGWLAGAFNASLGGEVILGPDDQSDDDGQDARRFGGLDSSRRSITASLGYSWSDSTRLSFRGYYRDNDGTSWGAGPQFTRSLYRSRAFGADLSLGATVGDQESLALARVTFRWAAVDRPLQLRSSLGARWRQADEGQQGFGGTGSFGGSYRFDEVLGGPTTLGAEIARDVDGTNRLTLDGEAETVYGSLNAGADLEHGQNAQRVTYRGFARTTLAANRDGVAAGGQQAGDAAILAMFVGDSKAGGLVVSTGAGNAVTVASGRSAALPVAPFRVYSPYASSAEDRILDLTQPGEALPLYPRNVATARWTVRQLYSLYGRIVRADGAPIGDARIQGVDGLGATDRDGYFVVEVEAAGDHRVEPRVGGQPCTVTLLAVLPVARQDVIGVGDVLCHPAEP